MSRLTHRWGEASVSKAGDQGYNQLQQSKAGGREP